MGLTVRAGLGNAMRALPSETDVPGRADRRHHGQPIHDTQGEGREASGDTGELTLHPSDVGLWLSVVANRAVNT